MEFEHTFKFFKAQDRAEARKQLREGIVIIASLAVLGVFLVDDAFIFQETFLFRECKEFTLVDQEGVIKWEKIMESKGWLEDDRQRALNARFLKQYFDEWMVKPQPCAVRSFLDDGEKLARLANTLPVQSQEIRAYLQLVARQLFCSGFFAEIRTIRCNGRIAYLAGARLQDWLDQPKRKAWHQMYFHLIQAISRCNIKLQSIEAHYAAQENIRVFWTEYLRRKQIYYAQYINLFWVCVSPQFIAVWSIVHGYDQFLRKINPAYAELESSGWAYFFIYCASPILLAGIFSLSVALQQRQQGWQRRYSPDGLIWQRIIYVAGLLFPYFISTWGCRWIFEYFQVETIKPQLVWGFVVNLFFFRIFWKWFKLAKNSSDPVQREIMRYRKPSIFKKWLRDQKW